MPSLTNGPLRVTIDPALGAAITAFSYEHRDGTLHLMRPAPEGNYTASDTNFLLAPYSNRIRDGAFRYAGQEYQLARADAHAIHGDIRTRRFTIVGQTPTMLLLQFDSSSVSDFNYPFALRYRAQYELGDHKLRSVLHITNCDTCRIPVGGGFHPYFSRYLQPPGESASAEKGRMVEAQLQFDAQRYYPYDGDPIPEGSQEPIPEAFSFRSLQDLRSGIDHCYGGWDGEATIFWPEVSLWMRLHSPAPMSHLVLYTPGDSQYFALEPVSNCTDAFNLYAEGEEDTGILELDPGETCKLEVNYLIGSGTPHP